jgi:hypothetical protein
MIKNCMRSILSVFLDVCLSLSLILCLRITKALQEAQSSISYVKMIVPKSLQEKSDGVTKIILPGGDDETKGKKPMTNWHGRNLDPDSVARHNRSLKRAGFLSNRHAKGIF